MGEDRLHVVIVSSSYSEPSLQRQISALSRSVDVELIVPAVSEVLVFPDFRVADHCVEQVRAVRNVRLFGTQFLFLSRDLGLSGTAPDIVHIEYDPWTIPFWQVRIVARLVCPGARVMIGSKKNTYRRYPGLLGRLKRAVAERGFRSAARIVCASEMNRDMLVHQFGLPAADVGVVTQVGVDVDSFRPVVPERRDRSPVVGYCGRMIEHKGVLDLVDAVAALRDAGTDVELHLLGAGPLDGVLRERAAEHDWLTRLPAVPVEDVPAFLAPLDVYVLPARTLADHQEHDAHAMLQAMACGVPVLATRSGIIPEILAHGDVGTLVDPNDVHALSRELGLLLDDPDRRVRHAGAGRSLVCSRYSMDAVADAKARSYRETLG